MQTLVLKTFALPVISLAVVASMITFYVNRASSRAALARLGHAHLADIGMDYKQANKESRKPFWM
ncbi:MAG: hypothetical protein JKY31_07850 [Rhodobacteraceae bacterium]|nr:hypothetical protein [Paracoccaceae bacterium]